MIWPLSSGAFLGWALGANDAANVFGAGVATQTISYRRAVLLMAVFILLGAVLEGVKCMNAVNAVTQLTLTNAFLATLSAGTVMLIMSVMGLPASSSQAIVGALLFFGLVEGRAQWNALARIGLCWVLTPFSAGLISVMLYKGLSRILRPLLTSLKWRTPALKAAVTIAGCYGAYTLGSNNVANVTGVYVGAGLLTTMQAAVFGGLAIAVGVLTFSRRTMMTVGQDIVPLDAFSAFISMLTLAVSAHLFTQIGVPVSGTQAAVGAVLGIGLLKDSSKIKLKTVLAIVLGWLLTPLAGLLICMIFFNVMNYINP
jgi:inorganic phosphate transporter, PiT family